ncbi:MAG: hypothetical protein QXE82_00185 [Candidatus Nitrosotenuis sp.]
MQNADPNSKDRDLNTVAPQATNESIEKIFSQILDALAQKTQAGQAA